MYVDATTLLALVLQGQEENPLPSTTPLPHPSNRSTSLPTLTRPFVLYSSAWSYGQWRPPPRRALLLDLQAYLQ